MLTEEQWKACESLIDHLVLEHKMSRDIAITALTIKDKKRNQFGLGPQIDGADFGVAYPSRDEAIHEDDVANVAFLEDVSIEHAQELTRQRFASGLFKAEQKH